MRQVTPNLVALRRRLHALRAGNRSGFTLLELVIVILIIMILVVLLIVAIVFAMSQGKVGETDLLFREIKLGIERWQRATKQGPNTFPGAIGNNFRSTDRMFDPNEMLYKALIKEPQDRGRKPYFNENVEKFTKEINGRTLFVDAWGNPIIYWEWASIFAPQKLYIDPTEHVSSSQAQNEDARTRFAFAENRTSYDLYSMGENGEWGGGDDMRAGLDGKTDAPTK